MLKESRASRISTNLRRRKKREDRRKKQWIAYAPNSVLQMVGKSTRLTAFSRRWDGLEVGLASQSTFLAALFLIDCFLSIMIATSTII